MGCPTVVSALAGIVLGATVWSPSTPAAPGDTAELGQARHLSRESVWDAIGATYALHARTRSGRWEVSRDAREGLSQEPGRTLKTTRVKRHEMRLMGFVI